MSAIPERRRRRTLTAVVLGVVGILALPGGLAYGVNSLLNSTSGKAVDTSVLTRVPSTPAALLVGVDETDTVTMLAMFALLPGGNGGTIVSIPVGANAEITKTGIIHRIADTYKTAGFDAFVNDVSGLLNISFSATALMTTTQLGEMLTPLGERQVVLDQPVLAATLNGAPRQVLGAGTQNVDGRGLADLLIAAQPGKVESSRWPLQKSLWQVIAATGGDGEPSPTIPVEASSTTSVPESTASTETSVGTDTSENEALPEDVPGFFNALMSGRVQYWQLSGTLITEPQRNPLRTDLYELDGGEVIVVMATVAPSAVAPANSSLSFMIDTPYEDAQIVRQAALRIAYVGGNVLIVRHIGGTPAPKTSVRYDVESVRTDMESFTTLFGPLNFILTPERVEGIDAQIILGEDFKAFIGSEEGAVIATTTTSTIAD